MGTSELPSSITSARTQKKEAIIGSTRPFGPVDFHPRQLLIIVGDRKKLHQNEHYQCYSSQSRTKPELSHNGGRRTARYAS